MDRKLVLVIIMVWAVWYLTREQEPPEEPTPKKPPEDPTMKNIKIVMERAKKPVKLKFNFKKTEE